MKDVGPKLDKYFSFLQKQYFQATLAILDKLDIETDKPTEEEIAKKFGFEESYHSGQITRDIILLRLVSCLVLVFRQKNI